MYLSGMQSFLTLLRQSAGWNRGTGIVSGIAKKTKSSLPPIPLIDNAFNRRGLRLVPGGGIEPPRAEARRILSYHKIENKRLTRFTTIY